MRPGPFFLSGVSAALGRLCDIRDVAEEGDTAETVTILKALGVNSYSKLENSPLGLMQECSQRSLELSGIAVANVDLVLVVTESYATLREAPPTRGETAFRAARNELIDLFASLGVSGAGYASIAFGGSSNFAQALFMAAALIEARRAINILVVCVDRHPAGVSRFMEDSVAITGDGVAACLLTQAQPPSAPSAWAVEHVALMPYPAPQNGESFGERVLDMYRSTKAAAAACYAATGRQPDRYDHLLLNNYNRLTSEVFSRLLGVDIARTFIGNVSRTGHLPSCDTLLNLGDLETLMAPAPGTSVLVFVNGPAGCAVMSLLARAPAQSVTAGAF